MLKLERARPFDEERPPLREERLERVEVDDRRIGFDLAEVGIRRGREREAGRQRVLQVEPDRAARIGRSLSGLSLDRLRVDAADGVRQQLELLRRAAPCFSPRSSPNCETNPLALRDSSGQVDVSASRPTSRITAKPTGPPRCC